MKLQAGQITSLMRLLKQQLKAPFSYPFLLPVCSLLTYLASLGHSGARQLLGSLSRLWYALRCIYRSCLRRRMPLLFSLPLLLLVVGA